MLTKLDEYQCHQIADTVDHSGLNDPSFYERYVFFGGSDDGMIAIGLGAYPNRQLVDGFAMVTLPDGRQHNARFSRDAAEDRERNFAGPLKVEVIEGLQELRLTLAPNAQGIQFDLTFTGNQPVEERNLPVFHRHRGRIVNYFWLYNQMGSISGWLEVDGNRIDVRPEQWKMWRDRTWGIRPNDSAVSPAPKFVSLYSHAGDEPPHWMLTGIQWPDSYTQWQRFARGPGLARPLWLTTRLPDGSPGEHFVDLEIKRIRYRRVFGDLRRFEGATIGLRRPDGTEKLITIRSRYLVSLRGGGYFDGINGFCHGRYMGAEFEDGEVWDQSSEADQRALEVYFCHDYWCEFESDGVRGWGIVELSDTCGAEWFERYAPEKLVLE